MYKSNASRRKLYIVAVSLLVHKMGVREGSAYFKFRPIEEALTRGGRGVIRGCTIGEFYLFSFVNFTFGLHSFHLKKVKII